MARSLRLSPLQWALTISVAVHLAVLALRLGAPGAFARAFRDSPLEVVLVNRGGDEAPRHAQALAQADLDGGGDARAGLSSTPLPDSPRDADGDALRDQSRQLAQEQTRERELLKAVRSQVVQLQQQAAQVTDPRVGQALLDQRRRLLEMIGAIERRIATEQGGPRRRFVGPQTRAVAYAAYYDRMRQRIERQGTIDFPQVQGRKLYGRLIMAITVDAAGRVVSSQVVHGSGDPTLDRMARAIVEAAQPYGRFSPDMRAQADQIVIVAGFDFTRDSGLETRLQARDPTAP